LKAAQILLTFTIQLLYSYAHHNVVQITIIDKPLQILYIHKFQLTGCVLFSRQQQVPPASVAQLCRRLRSQRSDRRRSHRCRARGVLQASRREMCHQANQLREMEHQHGRAFERDSGELDRSCENCWFISL